MEQTYVFLTPFNYFEWKEETVIQLRLKGLYRVTMGTKVEPNSIVEKSKFFNRLDVAFRMLCLIILRDFLFHENILTTPIELWLNIEPLLGNTNDMRGHHLENELISLSPTHFETIQDFFTKFKSLVLEVKQCGIEKNNRH